MTSSLTSFTSSGSISGTGFAKAKITGSSAILATICLLSAPATESPKNISAPSIASSSVLASVSMANCALYSFRSVREVEITPLESHIIMFSTPNSLYIFAQEIPAAPAPFTTILICSTFLPVSSSTFISPAVVMMAVPC